MWMIKFRKELFRLTKRKIDKWVELYEWISNDLATYLAYKFITLEN